MSGDEMIRSENVWLPSPPFWGERGWGWPDETFEKWAN